MRVLGALGAKSVESIQRAVLLLLTTACWREVSESVTEARFRSVLPPSSIALGEPILDRLC